MCTGSHAFIPAADVARLELIYTLDSQRLQNVLYFLGNQEWIDADVRELAETAATAWETNVAPVVSDELLLVLTRAQAIHTEEGAVFEFEPATTIAGAITGGSFPNNVTLTTKFASGFAGRSRRGRVYTPGIARASVATGAVNEVSSVTAGGFSSAWGTFASDIVDLVDRAIQHVVVSYCSDGAWRTNALVTPILSYSTNVTLDSQRRRLPERGQ